MVIVEDHAALRESLAIAFELRGDFRIVGQAGGARDAIDLVEKLRPDVMIADLMLSDTDGVALVRELRRRRSLPRTLILSHVSHPVFVRSALDGGALGFSSKEDSLEEIAAAARCVADGERHVSARLQQALADADAGPPGALFSLSPREREVFGRMLEGLSAKEIARVLCVSVKTVHTHRLQINRKLGVHSPAQFARLAAAEGFLRR